MPRTHKNCCRKDLGDRYRTFFSIPFIANRALSRTVCEEPGLFFLMPRLVMMKAGLGRELELYERFCIHETMKSTEVLIIFSILGKASYREKGPKHRSTIDPEFDTLEQTTVRLTAVKVEGYCQSSEWYQKPGFRKPSQRTR